MVHRGTERILSTKLLPAMATASVIVASVHGRFAERSWLKTISLAELVGCWNPVYRRGPTISRGDLWRP